jgi:hypothetical protein
VPEAAADDEDAAADDAAVDDDAEAAADEAGADDAGATVAVGVPPHAASKPAIADAEKPSAAARTTKARLLRLPETNCSVRSRMEGSCAMTRLPPP